MTWRKRGRWRETGEEKEPDGEGEAERRTITHSCPVKFNHALMITSISWLALLTLFIHYLTSKKIENDRTK